MNLIDSIFINQNSTRKQKTIFSKLLKSILLTFHKSLKQKSSFGSVKLCSIHLSAYTEKAWLVKNESHKGWKFKLTDFYSFFFFLFC
jgi:hypothetical protein